MPSIRQLAAVMFTDIQGYTALMQKDEEHAMQIRARHRKVFDGATKKYQGRILQYFGDGTLSIFNSVINAVNCAAEMQRDFQQNPIVPVRIGIHLGDIVVDKDEVIGDAVNIAARIESIAEVGSVLISDRVQVEIKNHDEIKTHSLGLYQLKNVKKPVEVFALANDTMVIPNPAEMRNKGRVDQEAPNNLPVPATRFYGRQKELLKVTELLSRYRLVTLLGPGGCGKTRLSIEAVGQATERYPDGVWFVGLATISDPELVGGTIAETLGVNPEKETPIEETLAKRLAKKKLLVIVDNCEHLIGECARIMNVLVSHTSEPRFLTTSREALKINGESAYRIPTLAVPLSPSELKEIIEFDSVQLFVDRATLSQPDFQLDENNAQAVASICKKLDGIPLAIEMAASRINMMDAQAISDRLSDQFRLLSSGTRNAPVHQRTIRATIDWSHDLLPEEEKILFRRLSVFSGDFDLEDAEKVCGYAPLSEFAVMDLLAQLFDKSLVTTIEKNGKVYYNLLELMKQYGLEKVTQRDELILLQQRYCSYYLDMVSLAHDERMKKSLIWSDWLRRELPNLQGAFNMLQNETGKRLKLASFLAEFFFLHGNLSVGRKILMTALEGSTVRNVDHGMALCGLGFLEILIDPEIGYQRMTEGVSIVLELGSDRAKMDIYYRYGAFKSFHQKWDEAYAVLEEGLRIAQENNDPWMEIRYRNQLIWTAMADPESEVQEEEVRANLEQAKRLRNHYAITDAAHAYAEMAFMNKDYKMAEKRFIEAAENARELGEGLDVGVIIHGMALAIAAQGRHEKALRLLGASNAKLEDLGAVLPSIESVTSRINETIGKSMEVMGPERSRSLDEEGRKMGFQKAVDYAFDLERD